MDKIANDLLKALRAKSEQCIDLNIKSSSVVKMKADECMGLCKKIGLVYKEGYEDRVVQFRFTDATADRHNEVVVPQGVDLKGYIKDPNVLLMHNSFTFPIGKSIETKFDPKHNDVVGKVLFFDDDVDRTGMSETTFRMVKAGAVKTGSIGFRAKSEDIRLASPDERKKYKLDKFGIIFDKIELREFSIVTIPANPNATQIASRKGMYTEQALETLKEKGTPEEELKLLTMEPQTFKKDGEDEDTSQDTETLETPENNNENDTPDTSAESKIEKGKMNVKLNIAEPATMDVIRQKINLARELTEEGYDVSVSMFGTSDEKNDVSEIIEKAGAVLSKKNKAVITSVLDNITSLKSDLEKLLGITDADEGKEDTSSDPVLNDSASDDNNSGPDIYALLDRMNEKVKS